MRPVDHNSQEREEQMAQHSKAYRAAAEKVDEAKDAAADAFDDAKDAAADALDDASNAVDES